MTKLKTPKKMRDVDMHDSLLKVQEAIVEATGDAKSHASQLISELLENFQSKGNDYKNKLRDHVSEEPLKSIGVAAVIGLLLGKFII